MSRRALAAYVEAYREAVGGIRYRDLASLQGPPFASLARGGGGTAYALWRLGRAPQARRWLNALLADRRPAAYDYDGMTPPRSSYLYGRAGLHWLAALIGGAGRERATAAYVRLARTAASPDFTLGAAGHLTGARLLLARFEHAGVRRLAEHHAERLLARCRERAEVPWQPRDASGFAFGWPGVLHAVLAWLRFSRTPPPAWLGDALHRLADAWSIEAIPDRSFAASWCNGAAGTALLWCEAMAATGDDRFVAAARASAQAALDALADEPRGYACCGAAGVAYALLALDRIDPRRGWRTRAKHVAAHAIRGVSSPWPNGLYLGHPGTACLAADLLADRPLGFPAIDA